MKLPNKKYNIIYADPPWKYNDKIHCGKRGADYKYETMSIEDIKNLDIANISEKNCALFIWVTFPFLQEGLDVIKAWGFEYKTIGFIWIKKNKLADTLFFGMGNWTRSNAEICLLAFKGKLIRKTADIFSIAHEPIQEHSRKPGIIRYKIKALLGDLPSIELFAREKTEGWDSWGNEIKED